MSSTAFEERNGHENDQRGHSATAPHPELSMHSVLSQVSGVVAPVWPLKDYVAVNPYAGISSRSFLSARSFLKVFSGCEMLMPMEYFANQFDAEKFNLHDVTRAIAELSGEADFDAEDEDKPSLPTADEILKCLVEARSLGTSNDAPSDSVTHAEIRTIAELATSSGGIDWTEAVRDEVSKHCASHYDEGQAIWSSPVAHLPLYQAWRSVATHDRNIEILGVRGFRKLVISLPDDAGDAIANLLTRLGVPNSLWSTFLLCQAFSVPGWSAWTKYQSSWKDGVNLPVDEVNTNHLAGLLAMRLAYDVAIAEAFSIESNWSPLVEKYAFLHEPTSVAPDQDAVMRMVLLRASEIGFRDSLVGSLAVADSKQTENTPDSTNATAAKRTLAQMVFCIDVRSERIRRHLESQSETLETFGFAGFFGMPIETVSLGQTTGDHSLPVLLLPNFKVHEGLRESEATSQTDAIAERNSVRTWRQVWSEFQRSSLGCFSFVETNGLLYGWKLARRAFGIGGNPSAYLTDGVTPELQNEFGPTLRGLSQQGMTLTHQADLVEGMLRNLGLTRNFASLVVLCGHASETDNNPLAAGLDCGACGGHSGEPNAKFAAMLLNQSSIRTLLVERGIEISDETHFVAGLHNTTTDKIEFFDIQGAPQSHHAAICKLTTLSDAASEQTRAERMPIVASDTVAGLMQRSSDWSEVRPEWALAGNAAFIVAPRSLTQNANLDGRSFLHSYDWREDTSGAVLETIMTAPMVVGHWINMQYYASTVDNRHFGSGTKTVHNVVGRFGILSGNGGDLQTGLPWQSLHTGTEYQHSPMRLQVIIAAPRESIDRVINQHALVSDLINGGWLHMLAIEDGVTYRHDLSGEWHVLRTLSDA